MVQLADGLARRGHDVSYETMYPGGDAWDWLSARNTVPMHAALPVRVRSGATPRAFRLSRCAAGLRKRLASSHAEILYSALYGGNLVAWVASRRTPVALVWSIRASSHRPSWRQRANFELGKLMAPSVDLAISNSTAGLVDHERRGYRARASLMIPNGIDTESFAPDDRARREVRAEWGVGDDEFVVGHAARLSPMKGHRVLIAAAARLGGARFISVGYGPTRERRALQREARERGLGDRVMFVDGRADMARVHNAFDVLVSPSTYGEGFPNAIGEAMATGRPCATTDVGDSAMIVGDTGEVCAPDDADALAAAIGRLRRRCGEEADLPQRTRGRIVRQFSVGALLAATEHAFARVLRGDHGGHHVAA